MTKEGMIFRQPDPFDGRRVYIALAPPDEPSAASLLRSSLRKAARNGCTGLDLFAGPTLSPLEALPLKHSWRLHDKSKHFELGLVLDSAITDLISPRHVGEIAAQHAGRWECDLRDNSLIWSGGVYDLFGLPRGVQINRDDAVAIYCENSRAAMESLRAYAIKHKRGFTVDVELKMAVGSRRWMRLIAAPVVLGGQVVKLHGLKLGL